MAEGDLVLTFDFPIEYRGDASVAGGSVVGSASSSSSAGAVQGSSVETSATIDYIQVAADAVYTTPKTEGNSA